MCYLPTATSIATKRQKNLVHSRITQTTHEREPGEIDLNNLPEKEFKIKVITMLMDLQRNMQELKDQVGRKNTEIKQSLEELKSRMDEMHEAVNGIEIREQEHREADAERDKRISRNERILRELCEQSKWNNICIIGVPEEEEREKGIESVFEEIMAENFLKLGEEIIDQTTEVSQQNSQQKEPKRANTKTHNN